MSQDHPLVDQVAGLPPGQWITRDTLEPVAPHPVLAAFATEMVIRDPARCEHQADGVPVWLAADPDRLLCVGCLEAAMKCVLLADPCPRCDACGTGTAAVWASAVYWPHVGFVALLCRACLERTV